MSDVAIHVERLSKRYQIGKRVEQYSTFRESLVSAIQAPLRALQNNGQEPDTREYWALRDVSFEVKRGEVLGLIGKNGAGKSTLLKILSQITEPTAGRAELRGRVGSLLEVGTGFHPELTGRENTYLNGAILGMKKSEISRRFDEIVDFAEVEQFLDTPVKRYSSGMYTRLAFSIAAHLESEILIVDEVLAVGDAAFQRKCLGKMSNVAQEGRTVLFVSHNMEAILRLCDKAILLEQGSVIKAGEVTSTVSAYLGLGSSQGRFVDLRARARTELVHGDIRLMEVRLIERPGYPAGKLPFGQNIAFEVAVEVLSDTEDVELAIALNSVRGFEVASCLSSSVLPRGRLGVGQCVYRVEYLNLRLVPGLYRFNLGVRSQVGFEDYLAEAFEVEIVPSPNSSELMVDTFHGVVVPNVSFELTQESRRGELSSVGTAGE